MTTSGTGTRSVSEDFDHVPSVAEKLLRGIESDLEAVEAELTSMREIRAEVVVLRKLGEVRKSSMAIERALSLQIADQMGKAKKMPLDGLGVLERHTDVSVEWDAHAVLRGIVKNNESINKDTGEITVDWRKVVDDLMDVGAMPYFRVQKMNDRGIEVTEDMRERKWGQPKVRLVS